MSTSQAIEALSRAEIRKIFSRHRGAASRLAADLSVSKTTLSLCLRGRSKSERILAAARTRAQELLGQEAAA